MKPRRPYHTPYLHEVIRDDHSDEIVAAMLERDAALEAAAKAVDPNTLIAATDRSKRAQATLGRLLLERDKAARPWIYAA